jgi:hypothetical protein
MPRDNRTLRDRALRNRSGQRTGRLLSADSTPVEPDTACKDIKSITAKEISKRIPSVKKQLWIGVLWSSGYLIGAVGKHGGEQVIQKDVRSQGGVYQKGHQQQPNLFDEPSE